MALTKISGNVVQQNNFNLTGIVTATSFTGDLTGDVTGNVTGDVTGDLTGNVTGNVSSSGANTLGSLTVTNDATVGGALTVTGNLTVNGTTTTIDTVVTAIDTLAVDGDVTAGGNLNITGVSTFGGNIDLGDNDKLRFGAGYDLEIYSDGTNGIIKDTNTSGGDLRLLSDVVKLMNSDGTKVSFKGIEDGAAELYYNNSRKLETTGYGVAVSGGLNVSGISTFQNNVHLLDSDRLQIGGSAGTVDGLEIYHNGSNSYISDSGTGLLYITTNGTEVRINGSSGGEYSGRFINNGAVELYYDNSKKFETTGAGVTITGDARVTGILTVGQNSTTINGAHEYPTIRPTLDLNFAATKTLDRRITFTRNSIGTYTDELGVLKYAPNNVPRFDHDPETGESLGLLIEESRTNLVPDSTTYNGWTTYSSSIPSITQETLAPDGTYSAIKIISTGTQSQFGFREELSYSANTVYTHSMWLKAGTVTRVALTISSSSRWSTAPYLVVDLDTGTVNSTGSSISTKLTAYPNGWYLLEATGEFGGTSQTDGIWSYTQTTGGHSGDTTSYYYQWGGQVEAGAFPTSYIPTSGSTVTRAADLAKITGTNFTGFYNSSEGTLMAHYDSTVDDGYISTFELSSSPSDNRIALVNFSAYQGFVRNGGTTQASLDNGTPTVGGTNKVVLAFKENDFTVSLNGATPVADASGTLPTVDTLMIGSRGGGAYDYLKSTIRQLTYYNKRLPNAQLQGLTAQ